MKISKKLIKDLKATLKEPDGLYVWVSAKDAEEILQRVKFIKGIRSSFRNQNNNGGGYIGEALRGA